MASFKSMKDLTNFLSHPQINQSRFDQIDGTYWIKYLIHEWCDFTPRHDKRTFSFVFRDVLGVLGADYPQVHSYLAQCASVLRHRHSFSPDVVDFLRVKSARERAELTSVLLRVFGAEFRDHATAWVLECAELLLSLCLSLVSVLGAESAPELGRIPASWREQREPGPFEARLRELHGSSLASLVDCTPSELAWLDSPLSRPSAPPPWYPAPYPEPDTWPYTRPLSTRRYEQGPDLIRGDKKLLLEVLELSLPPVWSRVYYQGDSLQLTRNFTDFTRVNSCTWIAQWLKAFDLLYLRVLLEPSPPLHDYKTTLERVLALPSAPKDLEEGPDFLLEPTLILQLPLSVALLQQWLVGALLVLFRFDTLSLELRHWPVPKELALPTTQLLGLVRVCKERLLLGLALLSRDVTTFPAAHLDTPNLLLDEVVLPSLPVLRLIIHGEGYAILNQLRHRAFSTSYAQSDFHTLRSVTCTSVQTPLCKHFFFHHINIAFWGHLSRYPYLGVTFDIPTVVRRIKFFASLVCFFDLEKLRQEKESFTAARANLVKQSHEKNKKSDETIGENDPVDVKEGEKEIHPLEGLDDMEAVPIVYSMIAELRRGPPSLLRSLVMMTGEYFLREMEVLHEKHKILETRVTPTLPYTSKEQSIDLETCVKILRQTVTDISTTNRAWLENQMPMLKKFDQNLLKHEVVEKMIMVTTPDVKSLVQATDKLIWNHVLYVLNKIHGMINGKIMTFQCIEIYTFKCVPLIFLQACTKHGRDENEHKLARLVICKLLGVMLVTFNNQCMLESVQREAVVRRKVCCSVLNPAEQQDAHNQLKTLDQRRKNMNLVTSALAELCQVQEFNKQFNESLVEFTQALTSEDSPRNNTEFFIFSAALHLLSLNWNLHNNISSALFPISTAREKTKPRKILNASYDLNIVMHGLSFASNFCPELNNLTSMIILRKIQPMLYRGYNELIKCLIYMQTKLKFSGVEECPASALQSTQSQVCALLCDVLSRMTEQQTSRTRSTMWELSGYRFFQPNKSAEFTKYLELKSTPFKKAQKALEERFKSESMVEKKVAIKTKKVKNDEEGVGEEARGVEKRPESKVPGEQESVGGSGVQCVYCRRAQTSEGRFRKGLCSARCRDKMGRGGQEKKRCGFCGRSQERWRGGEFLTCGARVFCTPECRDRWRANRGRPYEPGDWDCSHCARRESKEERFLQCPACVSDPGYPEPDFYCSGECQDTWWRVEHQAQHLEFELGLWDLQGH